MATLARKLRLHDYFALAFGTMIGTGWLVLMDDWLGRGGPLGAILGYAIGGIILLPVGYVYGQWVKRLPDAAGEAAYTAQVCPRVVSYFTGWMMLLAYFIVCPWEAVALGKLAAYVFPWLNSMELYRVAWQPVFLPRLVLGVVLTIFLGVLNYRGIRLSANFQKLMTSAVLVCFYAMCIAAVTYSAPWQSLLGKRFATAIAFESALKVHWPVTMIFTMALLGLFQCFNGNFAASTRLLFAFGRRRTIPAGFGMVHQEFQTPSVAVLGITVGTLGGLLLGDALLVPVTEVGSMASALGWFAACISFWMVEKRAGMRVVTGLGILVSLMLFLMKVLPVFPGHFSPAEWIAFGVWVALGAALHWGKS